MSSHRFPGAFDLGALSGAKALTWRVGPGIADVAFLGMVDGCGGAVGAFPFLFVSFDLIWARSPLCGWIWARSAGPKC